MNKKAFSLLEMIFVIIVIGIISTVAITKFNNTLNQTNIIKIKSDILMIRDGLNKYKNSNILKQNQNTLDTLELNNNNNLLFSAILDKPIETNDNTTSDAWSKISNNTYKVYLNDNHYAEYIYNSIDYSFICDFNNISCKKLEK